MALRLSLALQRHRVGRMPPARGASRHLDQPLRVRGEQVFAQVFDGDVELRQEAFVYMLGWVTLPSLGGELTDLGMQAVKDGWWVDPPPEVLQQVRLRQEDAFNNLQAWVNRQQREHIENEAEIDRALMPPPPPRPRQATRVRPWLPTRLSVRLTVWLCLCVYLSVGLPCLFVYWAGPGRSSVSFDSGTKRSLGPHEPRRESLV